MTQQELLDNICGQLNDSISTDEAETRVIMLTNYIDNYLNANKTFRIEHFGLFSRRIASNGNVLDYFKSYLEQIDSISENIPQVDYKQIEEIASINNIECADIKDFSTIFFSELKKIILQKETIKINHFGTFKLLLINNANIPYRVLFDSDLHQTIDQTDEKRFQDQSGHGDPKLLEAEALSENNISEEGSPLENKDDLNEDSYFNNVDEFSTEEKIETNHQAENGDNKPLDTVNSCEDDPLENELPQCNKDDTIDDNHLCHTDNISTEEEIDTNHQSEHEDAESSEVKKISPEKKYSKEKISLGENDSIDKEHLHDSNSSKNGLASNYKLKKVGSERLSTVVEKSNPNDNLENRTPLFYKRRSTKARIFQILFILSLSIIFIYLYIENRESESFVYPTTPVVKKKNPPIFVEINNNDTNLCIHQIIIRKETTLLKLSYLFYGNKIFWPYIYSANQNRIANPYHVKPDTKIDIPKMRPELIDTNNIISIQIAKGMSVKILDNLNLNNSHKEDSLFYEKTLN